MRRGVRTAGVLLAAGILASCEHGGTYAIPTYVTHQPRDAGVPIQLTFASSGITDPSWSRDGSQIVFTTFEPSRGAHEQCLLFLPPDGGQGERTVCANGPHQGDSVDAIESGAVGPDGRLVYLHSARLDFQLTWARRELVVAEPGATREHILEPIPFVGSPALHNGVSQARWLDRDRFVYRADRYDLGGRSGLFVMLVDLRTDPATFTVLPSTFGATSVDVVSPDTIIYTTPRSSLVMYGDLATGLASPAWDFGTPVAQARFGGGRIAAILGPGSGPIALADLAAGTQGLVNFGAGNYDQIALSPDGHRLVARDTAWLALWLFPLG